MTWIDTHCHLQLDDRPPADLLARAADVNWVVVPGVNLETSKASLALASQFPDRVRAAVGLHPHDASEWPQQATEIMELARKATAVGETGLDFYRKLSPPSEQESAFVDQLQLAKELNKPAVIHCRDAFERVHAVLTEQALGKLAVLHCWTGGRRWTKRFLELDCWFSFAGPIAFETGETIRLAAELVPPERALVETDTPYLSPPPFRNEPNEPSRVALVGEALAKVWSISVEEVARVTTANAAGVFGR
jgi:TatD DNase family protein